MSRAVCLRCGADKGVASQICPSCGHRPEGEGLLVAWLLSSDHLTDPQLDAVAKRVKGGESIRPSDAMLDAARRALGAHHSDDHGLPASQILGLFAVSVLLTPLLGWTLWASWRGTWPRSARQALVVSAPISVAMFAFVVWMSIG